MDSGERSSVVDIAICPAFKGFAVKGNVVDMAVGVVIGAAFGKLVTYFVSDVIMPPSGVVVGGMDFEWLSNVL